MRIEKAIETQILDWLNYQPGVFAFKVNTTGIWDSSRRIFRTIKNKHIHKGTADIIGIKNGKFFSIEVKSPAAAKKMGGKNYKLTEHDLNQLSFLEKIKRCKGQATRVCSLEEAIFFLKGF